MKTFWTCALAVLAVAGAVPLAQTAGLKPIERPEMASPEAVGFSTQGLNALNQAMHSLVDERKVAGITTLVARHGKVVSFDTYGVQNLETRKPLDKDTIFRIRSMTKPVTGVAMMMLWEEGKWTLDDPVAKHIPEFANLKVATPKGVVPQVRPMTMRQLMSHTAGFDAGGGYDFDISGPQGRYDQIPAPKLIYVPGAQSLRVMIEKLAKVPLAFQPGTDWRYSNANVNAQAYIVEKMSGQTLDVFYRTRIFEPLGMKDTGFWVEPSKASRVTNVFTYGPDKRIMTAPAQTDPTSRPVFLSGAGGLHSTAEDYFRFAQMLLNGGQANGKRFLKASTVELMRNNVLPEGVKVDTYGPGEEGIGFGMDFAIVMDPARAGTPIGKNSFYWEGAFGSWFWIDPTNDVVVAGMIQNVAGSNPTTGPQQVRLSRTLVSQALTNPRK